MNKVSVGEPADGTLPYQGITLSPPVRMHLHPTERETHALADARAPTPVPFAGRCRVNHHANILNGMHPQCFFPSLRGNEGLGPEILLYYTMR